MGMIVLFSVILLPVAEIAVFIEVWDWIGFWPALLLLALPTVLGLRLCRYQGFTTLFRVRESLAGGEVPLNFVPEGLLLLLAGALLVIPGFLTDGAGLLLLLPPLRKALAAALVRHLRVSGRIHIQVEGDSTILDGNYRDITPEGEGCSPSRTMLGDSSDETASQGRSRP
jgi:UPF0716 protein FxsA